MGDPVGDLVAVVIQLDAAADAQFKRDLALVIPFHILGLGRAAHEEAGPGAVTALHAGRHAGARVVLEIIGNDLLDGGLVDVLGRIGRAALGDRRRGDGVEPFLQRLNLLLLLFDQGPQVGFIVAGGGRTGAEQHGRANPQREFRQPL